MKNYLPIVIAVFCHMLTGSASVATRYLVVDMDPVNIAFLRHFLGGAFLLPVLFLFGQISFNRRQLLMMFGMGLLFFALFPFLFSTAFKYTTAARGALVLATMPLWAMLLSHLLKHDALTFRNTMGIILTITGTGIALYDKLELGGWIITNFKGELIMLFTAILGAIYTITSRPLIKKTTSLEFTSIAMVSGCLLLLPWAVAGDIINDVHMLSMQQVTVMIYLGIFGGGLAFFLFNWVLGKTSPTYTTLFLPINPLTAFILAAWLLDEILSPYFFIGAVIVIFGFLTALWSPHDQDLINEK